MDDKAGFGHGLAAQENPGTSSNIFEFQNGSLAKKAHHHGKAFGSRSKPTPSKWDDAQKWLVGLSGSRDQRHSKCKPRNSCADDRRLLHSLSQKGRDSCSSVDGTPEEVILATASCQDGGKTKKTYCNESQWRSNEPAEDSVMVARSVCLRDMGTEMTPIASEEPSRAGTPLRATTPALRSPISSWESSQGVPRQHENCQTRMTNLERSNETTGNGWRIPGEIGSDCCRVFDVNGSVQTSSAATLEARAVAWDEAERAKYTARYKREEMKIQAWENHEKRKFEMETKMTEVKADRLKARAQEKLANKLAATRRIAEEKRANAEAELNEHFARASEKADYIRRTGHSPSAFFSFKLPSLCG